ncbi:MAG: CHAT domain-containing protein [Bacteroidales bacterium]|nr:CHAT domain-containing protein [Bacteroidales bacterium]
MKSWYCLSPSMFRIYLEFIVLMCFVVQLRGQIYLDTHFLGHLAELKRENRFDEAIILLDLQLDSLRSIPNPKPAIENRLVKADIYRMNGQYRQSEDLLDSLHAFYFSSLATNEPLSGLYWTIQGTLFLTRGELEKGRSAIMQAIEIYSVSFGREDSLLAPCYNKLGNYFYYKRIYDSAMACYNKALELANNKSSNLEDRASYLQNIGIIHLELCDYAKAETCFLESLHLKETIYSPNSYSLGRIYLNLGRFYQGISALDKALFYIEKAERIYLRDGLQSHLELGSIYWNKGVICNILGDHEIAFTYLYNAKQIIESGVKGNNILLSPLFMDIGLAYDKNKEKDKAIVFYNSSLIGADAFLKAKIYRNLANLYLQEGDLKKAEEYFNKLPGIIKETSDIENPENALTFLYYGEFLIENGDERALEYLNKAFEIFSKSLGFHNRDVAASLQSIGDYYLKKDQLHLALSYYQKSLISISKSFTDTNILVNPSNQSLNTNLLLINILLQKAFCLNKFFYKNENVTFLISSVQTYLLCMDMIDQLRMAYRAENSQMLLSGDIYKIYKKAIDICLVTFGYTNDSVWLYKAFEISERGKSMVLLSELKDANAKKLGSIPEDLRKTEKEIKSNLYLYRNNIWEEENQSEPDENKLSYLRSNLLAYEMRYDSLLDHLERVYPDYFKLKYDPSVVSVAELQTILENDEVIIEYTLSEEYVYTFLISENHFEVRKAIIDSSFIQDIFAMRNNLDFLHVPDYSLQDYMDYQRTANKLYTILIEPVDNQLLRKRVIIIPDEELSYLSFESLIEAIVPSDTIEFRDLPYLINKCPISYAASSTILTLIKKGPRPVLRNGVLALAPSYDILKRSILANNKALAQHLNAGNDLPGAEWEVETILKIMKGKKLVGENATEAEFKKWASFYDILHFAMHTRIDDDNPLSSMLSFYPYGGGGEDGVLHTYEIYNLDLKGELAFLSACSTGNGKLQKGEGVLSLARAFTYAGMHSVVMTLWDVEDISSGNIIASFYQLLGKGYHKDVALRLAKLNYLEKTKSEIELHPAFWSGFVLYGNNRGFRQGQYDLYLILLFVLGGLIIFISFILTRRYIKFRKNYRRIDIDLPIEFRAKDRL